MPVAVPRTRIPSGMPKSRIQYHAPERAMKLPRPMPTTTPVAIAEPTRYLRYALVCARPPVDPSISAVCTDLAQCGPRCLGFFRNTM